MSAKPDDAQQPTHSEDEITAALTAWFANTKHGWRAAMRAALDAAKRP